MNYCCEFHFFKYILNVYLKGQGSIEEWTEQEQHRLVDNAILLFHLSDPDPQYSNDTDENGHADYSHYKFHHIISCYGLAVESCSGQLVMELAEYGSLGDLIRYEEGGMSLLYTLLKGF